MIEFFLNNFNVIHDLNSGRFGELQPTYIEQLYENIDPRKAEQTFTEMIKYNLFLEKSDEGHIH